MKQGQKRPRFPRSIRINNKLSAQDIDYAAWQYKSLSKKWAFPKSRLVSRVGLVGRPRAKKQTYTNGRYL
jgi:hypothetical protein